METDVEKVKVRTLDMAPFAKKLFTEALRYGTRCEGPHSFPCTPTYVCMN